jgi:hypothetical protein
LRGVKLQTTDIQFLNHTIWGATAGMLLTLKRLIEERRPGPP